MNSKKIFKRIIFVVVILIVIYLIFSFKKVPEKINYGVSFNTLYANELQLDWKEVYDAILNDLNVKRIRLSAHWDLIEPKNNQYNFVEIDYQVQKAVENDVEIILAVGNRLPRWPECHTPVWARDLDQKEKEAEVLEYIGRTINRYKDVSNIKIWQVENEPFLSIFAKEHCPPLEVDFLDKEIEFVRELDPSREILITDSGELSTWRKSYKRGDLFGTTLYVYAWNEFLGEFRNPVLPGFYSFRKNILNMIYGKRESIIAELALEPWLNKTPVEEDLDLQKNRMSRDKFERILEFAKKTGFETQYLWGAEWWYYMKTQGDDWYWERGKSVFK